MIAIAEPEAHPEPEPDALAEADADADADADASRWSQPTMMEMMPESSGKTTVHRCRCRRKKMPKCKPKVIKIKESCGKKRVSDQGELKEHIH